MNKQFFFLFFVSFSFLSCATRNVEKNADTFLELENENNFCTGSNKKVEFDFALSLKTPKGLLITSSLNEREGQIKTEFDKFVEAFPIMLASVYVAPKTNYKSQRVFNTTIGVLTWGLLLLISNNESELVVEQNFSTYELFNPYHFAYHHFVSDINEPHKFVICSKLNCEGLENYFSSKKISSNDYLEPNQSYTYQQEKSFSSDNIDRSSEMNKLHYLADLISRTGFSVGSYLRKNYANIEQATNQKNAKKNGFYDADLIAAIKSGIKITEKTDKDWVLKKLTIDLTEMCKLGRPRSELYTN